MFGPRFVMQYIQRAGCFTLCSCCHVASVLCLFLNVPYIDLQCVVVAFPGPSHLLSKVYNVLCAMHFTF